MANYGMLTDYTTGTEIREATREEWLTSLRAGETGAFQLEGEDRTVFVSGGPETEADEQK